MLHRDFHAHMVGISFCNKHLVRRGQCWILGSNELINNFLEASDLVMAFPGSVTLKFNADLTYKFFNRYTLPHPPFLQTEGSQPICCFLTRDLTSLLNFASDFSGHCVKIVTEAM